MSNQNLKFNLMFKMNDTITIPDEVVGRYAYKHNICLSEARSLFQQLEDFLDSSLINSSTPTKKVDEAWHEFVLHTKNYAEFCSQRYGRFIHHVPSSPVSCEADAETFHGSRIPVAANFEHDSAVSQKRFSITENGACSSDCEPSPE